ncbi:MAG: hypothetical protein ACK4N5_26965, partial [Myxococcales bacterium]
IVLAPSRTYAFFVLRSANDAAGRPLGVPESFARLRALVPPADAVGQRAWAVYRPLWSALQLAGIDVGEVAAATVFTTGDAVRETFAVSEALRARHTVEITDLRVDADDGDRHERYCELVGRVSYPQFQRGRPPFDTEGLFEPGADGLPAVQRQEEALVTLALPRTPMPESGFPLMLYFHPSGSLAASVVDLGKVHTPGGPDDVGRGPAHVVAAYGIASAGSGLPVNPERLPGAGETAYLNLANPAAFRDTFRQGIAEQRMFLDALLRLRIPPATAAACGLPAPPGGAFRFDGSRVVAQGQSMGGMYANLVGALEPRIRAVVPTSAGGYWSWFLLQKALVPNAAPLL